MAIKTVNVAKEETSQEILAMLGTFNDSLDGETLSAKLNSILKVLNDMNDYTMISSADVLASANNPTLSRVTTIPYSFKFKIDGQCQISICATEVLSGTTYIYVYKNNAEIARFSSLTAASTPCLTDVITVVQNDIITFGTSKAVNIVANSINVLGTVVSSLAANIVEVIVE